MTAKLFSEDKNDCTSCGIFHEPTVDVHFDDMPSFITIFDTPMQTIQLPCSHKFNSAAILRHFAVSNMQCPICRAGHPSKLNCDSIPPEFSSILQSEQTKSIQQQQQQESGILAQEIVFNEQAWLRGFSVVLTIQHINRESNRSAIQRAVFASPVVLEELADQFGVFGVQQSMRRNVEVFFNQQRPQNSQNSTTITLQLLHESQRDVFAQLELPQSMWMRFASQNLVTRQMEGLLDLKYGNTVIGHVLHITQNQQHWIHGMKICLNRDLVSNFALSYLMTWFQENYNMNINLLGPTF